MDCGQLGIGGGVIVLMVSSKWYGKSFRVWYPAGNSPGNFLQLV
jgi:hypothetical protein